MDTKWHAVVRGWQSTPKQDEPYHLILWTGKMGENGQRFIWIAKSLWVQTVGTLSSALPWRVMKVDRYRLGHLSVCPMDKLNVQSGHCNTSECVFLGVGPYHPCPDWSSLGEEQCLWDQADWKLKPGKHKMVGPTSLSWNRFSSSCAKKSIFTPISYIIPLLPHFSLFFESNCKF